jgi:hypothetical protein
MHTTPLVRSLIVAFPKTTSAPGTFRKTPLFAGATPAPVLGISLLFPAPLHDITTGEQTTGDLPEFSLKIAGSFKILYLEGCMLVRAFLRSRACGE